MQALWPIAAILLAFPGCQAGESLAGDAGIGEIRDAPVDDAAAAEEGGQGEVDVPDLDAITDLAEDEAAGDGEEVEPRPLYWAKSYDGPGYETFNTVGVVEDGGFIVGGTSCYPSPWEGCSLWVLRLDAYGDVAWERIYESETIDRLSFLFRTSDGGYIAGYDYRSDDILFIMMKISGAGDIEWSARYRVADGSSIAACAESTDGEYVAVGNARDDYSGMSWVMKVGEGGDVRWLKLHEAVNVEGLTSISHVPGGGFIIGGYSKIADGEHWALWLAWIDEEGNAIRQLGLGGEIDYDASSIQRLSDGGYALIGLSSDPHTGLLCTWVVRLDAEGDVEWQRCYGAFIPSPGPPWAIHEDRDGGFLVAGSLYSQLDHGTDCYIAKLDGSGAALWERFYGGTGGEYSGSIKPLADGGLIVAGTTYSYGLGGQDGWLLRLGPDGLISTSCPDGMVRDADEETFDTGASIDIGSVEYVSGSARREDMPVAAAASSAGIQTQCTGP